MKLQYLCQYCASPFFAKPSHQQKFCCHPCSIKARQMQKIRDIAQTFWQKVDTSAGIDGCWLWTGRRQKPRPYGIVCQRGSRIIYAHRYAYEQLLGPIPDGLFVLHHCDNPPCCNAARHLFLGTNADNIADAVKKHRMRPGQLTHPEAYPYGERSPRAKLSTQQIQDILALHGKEYQYVIAERFHVSQPHISRIFRHKTRLKG